MLANIELMFTDLELMLRKLKKLSYEENMKRFQNEQGHFIDEMINHVKGSRTPMRQQAKLRKSFPTGYFRPFRKKAG